MLSSVLGQEGKYDEDEDPCSAKQEARKPESGESLWGQWGGGCRCRVAAVNRKRLRPQWLREKNRESEQLNRARKERKRRLQVTIGAWEL